MNLLDVLKSANGGQNIEVLSNQFGLSTDQAGSVIGQLLPGLTEGLKNNVSQQGGLESLLGALTKGNHAQYIDQPEVLTEPQTVEEGNGILGHLLGSKQASRELAGQASANTGISQALIQQILPVVASMAMGALAKQRQSSTTAPPLEGLAGMLDMNRDGSAVDDVMGIVGRMFGR
jgi:hypothetical protein